MRMPIRDFRDAATVPNSTVSATRGIPPQANVIGTTMFVVALLVVVVGQLLARARRRG
jgi:hypothetical protein